MKKVSKIISFLCAILMVLSVAGCKNTSSKSSKGSSKGAKADAEGVKIKATETSDMKYEDFDNGLVSLKIPKGWKVDVPEVGYASYTFKAYDPNNTNCQFLFCLKMTGFLKTEAARKAFASLYPSALYGRLSAIEPQTTEGFFKAWNNNAKICNTEQIKREYLPYFNDFSVIENLGKIPLGGDVLRANFKNDKGELMQGLFTASIYSAGSYYMYGHDFAPLSTYHNIVMSAPDTDFNNWQAIMDYCIGTVSFSEKFMEGFRKEEQALVSTVQANAKIYDEMSDMIMDSWEKRSNAYDIASQKQSDATLGYERVYDTDTNEVYRAYNGFTDGYSGEKYKPVTDDMYTSAISGYIEK